MGILMAEVFRVFMCKSSHYFCIEHNPNAFIFNGIVFIKIAQIGVWFESSHND